MKRAAVFSAAVILLPAFMYGPAVAAMHSVRDFCGVRNMPWRSVDFYVR